MGKDTEISLADHKFNPWRIVGESRVVAAESAWKEPLKWDREAKALIEQWRADSYGFPFNPPYPKPPRPRVFCASMADVFEDWQWPMIDHNGDELADYENVGPLTMSHVRYRLFDLIASTPNLDWLLLTKRPENIASMIADATADGWVEWPWKNVWLGTTVENQAAADERIPHLLRVPARVRFLSCEPLLGPINLSPYVSDGKVKISQGIDCDWVIAGGESGPHARPMHTDWVRSLRNQCQAAGVPFWFSGWGEWVAGCKTQSDIEEGAKQFKPGCYHDFGDHNMALRVGKAAAGRMLYGREWDEIPEDA